MDNALQFDRAEFAGQDVPVSTTCSACEAALNSEYFAANGQTLCRSCADGVRQVAVNTGTGALRFAKAILLGGGAALLGGIVYFTIMKYTDHQWALLSILLGFVIGRAVRRGSGQRGGWRYQLLAALLTYFAIAGAYAPFVVSEFRNYLAKQKAGAVAKPAATAPAEGASTEASPAVGTAKAAPTPGARPKLSGGELVVALIVVALTFAAAPLLAGLQNPIGLLIIGFGVWQAWKVNRALKIEITGPHAIGTAVPPPLPESPVAAAA